MVEVISKECAGNGPELQLMVVGGSEVGVVHVAKDYELRI